MKERQKIASIELQLRLSKSLLSGIQLQQFQDLIIQLAPQWTSRLHLWRFNESPLWIDAAREGALQETALTKGIETRGLYGQLAEIAPPTYARRTGSMELRGAYRGLTIVIGLDDWI